MQIDITDTSIAVEGSKEEWMEFIPQLVAAYRSGDFVYAEFVEWFRDQQKSKADRVARSAKKPGLDFYDRRIDKRED